MYSTLARRSCLRVFENPHTLSSTMHMIKEVRCYEAKTEEVKRLAATRS